jgi:hypothetical protein
VAVGGAENEVVFSSDNDDRGNDCPERFAAATVAAAA